MSIREEWTVIVTALETTEEHVFGTRDAALQQSQRFHAEDPEAYVRRRVHFTDPPPAVTAWDDACDAAASLFTPRASYPGEVIIERIRALRGHIR